MATKGELLQYGRIERLALADWFATLDDDQLDTPSVCSAWTVRDVLGHLASPILIPRTESAKLFVRARSFDRLTIALTEAVRRHSTEEQVAALRRSADAPFVPPLVGVAAPLTDAVIHGEDARIPLGARRDVPADHLRAVLDFGVSPKAMPVFVPFRRHAGVRFVATDLDWSHGTGATIEGPALQVALAVFGRIVAATELTGDGVAVLSARSA